jgi:type IV secretory pathway VirB4 component
VPLLQIRRRASDKAAAYRSSARRFTLGIRTLADLIAPGAVEVERDHLRLDGEYARSLAVIAYPRTVSPDWFHPLIDFEEPIDLSLHLYPLDPGEMKEHLRQQLVKLESSRRIAERGGQLADPEREVAYADAARLRDALQRGDEKAFSVSFYALLRAKSHPALDVRTRRVESTLAGMLAQSRVAYLEQDSGFHSCQPIGEDHLRVFRNLDTSSLATLFPFTSRSLAMERGVLYGVATHTHAPVIVDPFDASLENANLVVFAKSGAGKSYFTKLMALRNLLVGVDFLVIDPEDEYRTLCQAVGGQVVRLASGATQQVNPFDLPTRRDSDAADDDDPLAEQIARLLGLLEIMVSGPGEPLGVAERALLDQALWATYARAGITRDPCTHDRPAPLLRDLHATLSVAATGFDPGLPIERATSLATRLRPYVDGSAAGLFASPTTVRLDRPFVVFNVQALAPALRPLAIHLISGFVWNQVRRKRTPRLLIIDEAWSLLQYPEGGAFLASMARRARKYYLGLVTITQDVADFLGCPAGQTVLANAALKLLLKQDGATIEPIVQAFQLTSQERQLLLGAGKGEGIFFACGGRVALQVEASPLEHRLATTAPRELAGRESTAHDVPGGGR